MDGEMSDMDIACETDCGPDAALKKWATELELRQSAERRHLFWRTRCLEHARTIDKQHRLIYELRSRCSELEKFLGDIAKRCDIPFAVDQEIRDVLNEVAQA